MKDLLVIKDLVVEFRTPEGVVQAVNGISYSVAPGEIVAIVGESGSGKSVGARAILGLIPSPPGKIVSGSIAFDDIDLLGLDDKSIRDVRGKEIAMVFQEPMTSLNPVISIGRQLTEAMKLHLNMSQKEANARGVELLEKVGISDPEGRLSQYPHQLSGGMRQRVMIAMALSCYPKLILADEPTTALDVTVQAQVLSLMKDLCREMGVALVIITHNLGIVARYAHRVNVMYAGKIVETGIAAALYANPSHPYTLGLLNSVPRLDQVRGTQIEPIPGSPPDLADLGPGCAFEPRCRFATARCRAETPPMIDISDAHSSACWEVDALHQETAA
ncbi:ABC transporter ATP-binding protein [Sulfitobacter sp. SK011]|uniref:ABC transporter ATP-binding protein n=1 Tax=Sulfitobacter sp. SK011 TaxID=1389004 RepID=UPI000E0A45C3|nr:ABC transporter ATP-binding protein [Sulfitobacter sp. SK011]AXI43565.1 peptide ABC transporter ATP-binding protein [Sulfitobacter sp. SK011]